MAFLVIDVRWLDRSRCLHVLIQKSVRGAGWKGTTYINSSYDGDTRALLKLTMSLPELLQLISFYVLYVGWTNKICFNIIINVEVCRKAPIENMNRNGNLHTSE